VVASARAESAAGSARRLRRSFATPTKKAVTALPARRINQPQQVSVRAHVDGTPAEVNRAAVALVREEWRVVDRWWTEEPVSRRYFDVVLGGGEHAVVFFDEEVGRWFSQRGS
jgi:hypothetical protein